jgi:hypothetical protein
MDSLQALRVPTLEAATWRHVPAMKPRFAASIRKMQRLDGSGGAL